MTRLTLALLSDCLLMRIQELRELARLYSIQVAYEDASGKKREASKDALLAALKLRVPEGVDYGEALKERKRAFWERMVEPVTVVWGRRRPALDLRLTETAADGSLDWHVQLEDGTTRAGRVDLGSVRTQWSAEGFVGKNLVVDETLPFGYHVLRVTSGSKSAETLVIVAPTKAHPIGQRSWGIFTPLYAARTERSWGAGDLGDLQEYRQWMNDLGGSVMATLPMLAAFEDEPSPYSPVSRLFWNEMYLDATRLPEFDSGMVDPYTVDALARSAMVDYAGVHREKRRVLEKMAARFKADGEFFNYAKGGAFGYAHFRAAKEERDSANYHLYVQYRMTQQMREVAADARRAGGGLYLDFPLGVNPAGFDAWKYGEDFAKGVSVGSPPDDYFTKGQNWGFAPFDPDTIRERRYEYFRAAIRHHMSHAGILRIDHVMGLHRLFWIPEGGEPKDGVYVRYPEDELYAVLVLESSRHRCAVVGEDLGTVPEYVPRMMKKHGLRRMYVVQYEVKPEAGATLPEAAVESAASVNTHDMPTFAGFWAGRDIDDRLQQHLLDSSGAREEREKRQQIRHSLTEFLTARGLLQTHGGDTRGILEALLQFLSGSSAEIVLVNLEDLWLEMNPQNVPGVPERSWRNKLRMPLEELRADARVAATLRAIDARRKGIDGGTS